MIRRVAVVSALLAGTVLVSSPASAAEELGLSHDGLTFTSSLPGPLFDADVRWVPGDVDTATFFVRNQAASAGELTVSVAGAAGDLLTTGDLLASVRTGAGAWVPVSGPGSAAFTAPVAPAATEQVDLRVAFDPDSTNVSQLSSAQLRVDITLSEADVTPPDPDPDPGPAPGPDPAPGPGPGAAPVPGTGDIGSLLPATGSLVNGWYLGLAALLLGAGSALAARRRDSDERTTTHV